MEKYNGVQFKRIHKAFRLNNFLKMNPNNPFFIIGSQRSGTTLLRTILANHSEIFIPLEETRFIYRFFGNRKIISKSLSNIKDEKLLELLRKFLRPERRNTDLFSDINLFDFVYAIKNKKSYSAMDMFDEIMNVSMQKFDKNFWGEKSPEHTLHLNTLNKLYPHSKFVIIVRDGRDVTASLFRRTKKWNNFLKLIQLLSQSFKWKFYMRSIVKFSEKKSNNCIILRYEDLIANAEEEVKRLCKFMNINFESNMMEFSYSNSAYDNQKKFQKTNKGVVNKKLYTWKDTISKNFHQKIINIYLEKMLYNYNYISKISSNWLNKLLSFIVSVIVIPFAVRIWYNKLIVYTGYRNYIQNALKIFK
jgi:hypothetical protein